MVEHGTVPIDQPHQEGKAQLRKIIPHWLLKPHEGLFFVVLFGHDHRYKRTE